MKIPADLVELVFALPPRVARWIARRLGVEQGLHEWAHQFCVCGEDHE